ncbi:MAG TPA: hypothetical protein PKV71_16175 [Calditrichia bacterium]|nr:hypothetical protein [Calditrichota bacterium]HQU71776.1 hypothetical protein [Calditrichia bacterium]HQV33424.1 hypothetical protein [Calditrichia bacterium]
MYQFPQAPASFTHHHHHAHGGHFCHSCCHPASECCCHDRSCRKESKELLVVADRVLGDQIAVGRQLLTYMSMAEMNQAAFEGEKAGDKEGIQRIEEAVMVSTRKNIQKVTTTIGSGSAFVGGGCCAHLSVEYMPQVPTALSTVFIGGVDSEGHMLLWGLWPDIYTGYKVKECIISTKPGARLMAITLNMTARIRWCEVFSC